ncbi:MAG: transglutaminase family protein [Acidobacteriota bacterium]|nr:transglutaminase family protein [Acidobacteriota bacterium]
MLIKLGYDIQFDLPSAVSFVGMVCVHPSRSHDLQEPDELSVDPNTRVTYYIDSFGNRCARFLSPQGSVRLSGSTLIYDSGAPDPVELRAREMDVEDLPEDTVQYLLSSRYCEVDLLSNTAAQLFGGLPRGWQRVQAVCDWVHNHVTFGYEYARRTRTALEVFNERVGVCRDFQHLAVTLCRCLNIPARYATGYLGDIGVPFSPAPMDFSAWFEVYLENRWWSFDARHNTPRIGRILMATGRDAADVAITTSFGAAYLKKFEVVTEEVFQNLCEYHVGESRDPLYAPA